MMDFAKICTISAYFNTFHRSIFCLHCTQSIDNFWQENLTDNHDTIVEIFIALVDLKLLLFQVVFLVMTFLNFPVENE